MRAERRGTDTVIRELHGTEPWRPRVLPPDGVLARIALVQSRGSLLGGDQVAVEVELGDGCALEVVELGALVAHHARGGPAAGVRVSIRLGLGARLIWLGEPLIAAAGCRGVRATRAGLAGGARGLLGEALLLGRAGEEPGRARTHTRITMAGRPLVEETLDTDPAWLLRSSAVVGTARLVEALTLAGRRDPAAPPLAFQAYGPATLWRTVGPSAKAGSALARRWRRLVLGE